MISMDPQKPMRQMSRQSTTGTVPEPAGGSRQHPVDAVAVHKAVGVAGVAARRGLPAIGVAVPVAAAYRTWTGPPPAAAGLTATASSNMSRQHAGMPTLLSILDSSSLLRPSALHAWIRHIIF